MNRRRLLATSGLAFVAVFGGYLEAQLGRESKLTCDGTDADASSRPDEWPRVDEPPHDSTRPDGEDEWHDDYLGGCMATDPSLLFDVLSCEGSLPDWKLPQRTSFRVELVTDETERDDSLELGDVDDKTRERIATVDFDESVLVLVESGWGSGSVRHRWVRVEDVDDGLHLHGYYEQPYEQHLDSRTWVSLLEVERPDDGDRDPDLARVSLTIREDYRVHFDSTEGTALVTSDGKPETYTIESERIEFAPEDEERLSDDATCDLDSQNDAVQSEIRSAIENGAYRTSERPALLDSDCIDVFVQYEGDYYRITLNVS